MPKSVPSVDAVTLLNLSVFLTTYLIGKKMHLLFKLNDFLDENNKL